MIPVIIQNSESVRFTNSHRSDPSNNRGNYCIYSNACSTSGSFPFFIKERIAHYDQLNVAILRPIVEHYKPKETGWLNVQLNFDISAMKSIGQWSVAARHLNKYRKDMTDDIICYEEQVRNHNGAVTEYEADTRATIRDTIAELGIRPYQEEGKGEGTAYGTYHNNNFFALLDFQWREAMQRFGNGKSLKLTKIYA